MGTTEKHPAIRAMEAIVDRFAGEEARKKVMEGSDGMTKEMEFTREIAEWVREAMVRLDELVDEPTRIQIMENCGYECAEVHRGVIDAAMARRKKYRTVDEYLEAEQTNTEKGTRLVRDGDMLYQFYRPQELGVNCFCGLVRAADEEISRTYCHCSKGFVKKLWESVLGRPLEVSLVQSVVSGAEECKFAIQL